MQIVPVPILTPNLEKIENVEAYLQDIKSNYFTIKSNGVLTRQDDSAVYIHQIKNQLNICNGIGAAIPIEAHYDGQIKWHESTLKSKEETQLNLLVKRRAQIKPIMMIHENLTAITHWIEQNQAYQNPFLQFFQDGIQHRIWKITAPIQIAALQAIFEAQVGHLYIGDGHHRTAAALRYAAQSNATNHLFCTLFNADQINILPFHRMVEGIKGRPVKDFLQKLDFFCHLKPLTHPTKHTVKNTVQMYVAGSWYELKWKKAMLENCMLEVEKLDAALLDQKLLEQLMNITDIRENAIIRYVNGGAEQYNRVATLVNEEEDRVGFCLHPVAISDFINVVNEGSIMPPKSTWFQPRMLSGVMVYEMANQNLI